MVRDPALAAGLVANLLVMAVLMATLVVGPFYLSRALGLDATRVGLAMSAGPLVVALAGVPAGRLADRFGGSPMIVTGLVGVMAGCVLLFLIPARFGVPGYLGPLAVLTGGYALFQTANNTAVMANVAPDQRGVTSGMLSLSRNLGLITGASVMGAVFALSSGTSEITAARPESIANGMRITFAVGAIVTALALAVTAGARAAAGRALFGPCPFSGRRS
jgi:MFS family permease